MLYDMVWSDKNAVIFGDIYPRGGSHFDPEPIRRAGKIFFLFAQKS